MLTGYQGKTVQAISWLTWLRDNSVRRANLIVCPLSTLDNWIKEIKKWTPTMPAMKYHGTEAERDEVYDHLVQHYSFATGKTDDEFPIICTTFEMLCKDRFRLAHFDWDQVFIVSSESACFRNLSNKYLTRMRATGSRTATQRHSTTWPCISLRPVFSSPARRSRTQ
jgi:ATP-dependent DNA helicase